jgi:hypothetical protein
MLCANPVSVLRLETGAHNLRLVFRQNESHPADLRSISMSQKVSSNCMFVRFMRQRGFYRVEVNPTTERAIERLTFNKLGFYEVKSSTEEAMLWRHAQWAADNLKELESLKALEDLSTRA